MKLRIARSVGFAFVVAAAVGVWLGRSIDKATRITSLH